MHGFLQRKRANITSVLGDFQSFPERKTKVKSALIQATD